MFDGVVHAVALGVLQGFVANVEVEVFNAALGGEVGGAAAAERARLRGHCWSSAARPTARFGGYCGGKDERRLRVASEAHLGVACAIVEHCMMRAAPMGRRWEREGRRTGPGQGLEWVRIWSGRVRTDGGETRHGSAKVSVDVPAIGGAGSVANSVVMALASNLWTHTHTHTQSRLRWGLGIHGLQREDQKQRLRLTSHDQHADTIKKRYSVLILDPSSSPSL